MRERRLELVILISQLAVDDLVHFFIHFDEMRLAVRQPDSADLNHCALLLVDPAARARRAGAHLLERPLRRRELRGPFLAAVVRP
jgi:hypothetical protein